MKTSRRLVHICATATLCWAITAPAQTTEKQIAREQAELEKKRAELERKSAELQQREAEIERARQALQNQQSGRSLSMNLSGDVLFDYDQATPEVSACLAIAWPDPFKRRLRLLQRALQCTCSKQVCRGGEPNSRIRARASSCAGPNIRARVPEAEFRKIFQQAFRVRAVDFY